MVQNLSEQEKLEEKLEVEEERIAVDEKRIRNVFFITTVIAILAFINIAIIYSFILKPRVISQKVIQVLPTSTPTTPIEPSPIIENSIKNVTTTRDNIKEYFISFGTGSGSSSDWTDVEGLLANINFSNYTNIKQILFEVSTQIPTGNENISVRLYNKTDDHPVWNSDIASSGTTGYSVSSPIIFDEGEKTYQIQMKTQLKYPANITQSRLHIILN